VAKRERVQLAHKFVPVDVLEHIVEVKDLSGDFVQRRRVIFKNGLQLSVISGWFTDGLFEIAPMTAEEDWLPEIFDEEDKGDTVLNHCSPEKVIYYIEKIISWPKEKESNSHISTIQQSTSLLAGT
jgi:hypothetical protein